eukprot:TRINITY_DN44320_c0_g1_i1.p1 TRINITY_DN44320_c0_g1~~TRINITY_DN44320_c0_g1_i1.p1  ORF type:complete len:186 (+),score=39.72 TRINITY_DN44320_c0_g1_i1:42-599(+)
MTTAHRPTYHAALGGSNSNVFPKASKAAKDAPHHLTMKKRTDLTGEKPKPPKDDTLKPELKKREEDKQARKKLIVEDPDEDLNSSDDSDDDDDEDVAELMRELERIKKERAQAEEKKKEEEQMAKLNSNELVDVGAPADFRTKKRWNDDVVFKNAASSEPELKKRFINDSLRSDFHKRFMHKYFR